MNKKWFIVYCKSREESRAQQNLLLQGIESFFPKIYKERMVRGKTIVHQEALFPCYLFVFIDLQNVNFSRIRSTRGVNDFVRFGREIATVPVVQITQLKNICHSINNLQVATTSFLKNGDKIEISQGPFQGIMAIFAESDGLERSILLLNVLNQENKVSFSNKDIKKLEN